MLKQLNSKAIREMLPIIDPEEDYLTIVAAEEKIIASETKRKKELEEAHAKLKGAFVCVFIHVEPT
jgi:kinetochore protein Spc24